MPALCRLAEALVRQHAEYDLGRYQFPADVAGAYAAVFAERVGHPESVVVVAERGGELVAYAFGVIEPPSLVALSGRTGWIHDLYVAPAARGIGVGGSVLDETVTRLRALGCPGGVLLCVAPQNAPAAALFRRRGFRPTLQEMTLGPWPDENV